MKRGGGSKSSAASKLSKKKNAENRQAKLQGSSSARFVEYLAHNGAPVPTFTGGLASYRISSATTTDLTSSASMEDPEFARCVRLLGKRDIITREKALLSLKEFFESKTVDELKPLAVIWANRYARVFLDNARTVRLALHEAMNCFIQKTGKHISPALSTLAGPWLCSLYDPVSSVASAALASFVSAFPDRDKQKSARQFLLAHFLVFAESMFSTSPKTVAEPWDSKEESDERYQRIVCSCIGVLASYDYASIASANASVLKASKSKNAIIRKAVYEYIHRHCGSWDSPGPSLSLMSDQVPATRRYMWAAVVAISSRFPEEWTVKFVEQFLDILRSSNVDQYAYAACSSVLQTWAVAPVSSYTASLQFRVRFLDAIWSGTAIFSKNSSPIHENALHAAFTICFDVCYDSMPDSDHRSEFVRECVWNRLVGALRSLQGTPSNRSDAFRIQEAAILSESLSTLGHHLRAKYSHSWIDTCLSDLCCDLLCPDRLLMAELARVLLAADRPVVTSAVFIRALDCDYPATITLCNSLIGHFPIDDSIGESVNRAFQRSLESGAPGVSLVELCCRVSDGNLTDLFETISQSSDSRLLLDFVQYCQSSDADLWERIGSACLQRFTTDSLTEASATAYSTCFRTLRQKSPSATAVCSAHLLQLVLTFSQTIQDLSIVAYLTEHFSQFESTCRSVAVALTFLSEARHPTLDYCEAVFFVSCLSVFTLESSSSASVDSHVMQHLCDQARSLVSGLSTDQAQAVFSSICANLKQQLLGCGSGVFDHIVWASFTSHVPAQFLLDCFPDSHGLFSITEAHAGQLIDDACMEVMDIVASDLQFPGSFQIALWMLEAHLVLDQRAGRLVVSRATNGDLAADQVGEMLDIALMATEIFDEFHVRQAARQFSRSLAAAHPEPIRRRFASGSLRSQAVLLPALAMTASETAQRLALEQVPKWSGNCHDGIDVDLSATCLAEALAHGFQLSRDSIFDLIDKFPASDAHLCSRHRLLGAAIESFPINEAATEVVDAVAWVKDVLEEQDSDRIHVALLLLKSITKRCGSNPVHIQEAIDLCLPLLSLSSLSDLQRNPQSLLVLRDLVSLIDFGTIPQGSLTILIRNLLPLLASSLSEMCALAYALVSRALASSAQSAEIGDPDPHCDQSSLKAELLIPRHVLDAMLVESPATNADPVIVRRYLLIWLSFIDAFEAVSAERRDLLTGYLRYSAHDGVAVFFQELMEHILGSPSSISPALVLESNAPANLPRIPPFLRRVSSSPHSCRLFGALAGHIYYRALSTFPVLARLWYSSCERSAAEAYKKLTAKRFTPLLIEKEVAAIDSASTAETFSFKCSRSGEIIAVLRHSDITVRLLIRLAAEHPLRTAEIDLSGTKGVDAKRIKWWTLNINMMMSSRNGSVQDAVQLWKRNVESHFEGVEECPICYSILHAVTDQVPRLACRVCKNRFHSACLYKWFSSSSGSSCPLCRSPF